MTGFNILAVGEVLFDVIEGSYRLGGAPFNVAAHMARLGNQSYILSAVGEDNPGDQIFREARQLNVHTELIYRNSEKPTGTVLVEFQDGEPEYEIVRDVAWDYLEADMDELKKTEWSVVAFGSLAQRGEHNQIFYQEMFENLTAEWIYFDCNLRQQYYSKSILADSLKFANIAKFNEQEVQVVSELLYDRIWSPKLFAEKLHSDFGISIVIFTFGKEGSKVWYQGNIKSAPGIDVKAKDSVGAGDAFSAGFLHSWIRGVAVGEALKHGNRLGGYVASHSGAIPPYDEQINSYFGDEVK